MTPIEKLITWKNGAPAFDTGLGGTVEFVKMLPSGNISYRRSPFMGKPHLISKRDDDWVLHWFKCGFWDLVENQNNPLRVEMGSTRCTVLDMAMDLFELKKVAA